MVYIVWVRHGYSCGNMYTEMLKTKHVDPAVFRDAPLTNYAELQSIGVWETIKRKCDRLKLKIIPYVFTSILTRAIQTGDLIAPPNYDIVPISYVNEVNISGYDNEYNLPRNRKQIEKDIGFKLTTFKNPFKPNGEPKHKTPSKHLFYNEELVSIIKQLKKRGVRVTNKSVFVIVSHGAYIMSVTGKRVNNFGIVLQNCTDGKSDIVSQGGIKPHYLDLDYDMVANCDSLG